MSTSMMLVFLSSSIKMLMPRISKTRKATTGLAQVTEEMAPQPTSVTSRLRPRFSTMAAAAGVTALLSRFTSRLMPTKPQVIVMPHWKALLSFRRKMSPSIVMMMGSMT